MIEGAVIRLLGLDAEIAHPAACRAAKGLKMGFDALNRGIRDATDGLFDARTLAGVALAAGGLGSMVRRGTGMPGAMTLLWWATDILGGKGNGVGQG